MVELPTYYFMKFHRNLFIAIIQGLKEILLDKKQADSTIEKILISNKAWGARDRNFIAENIYNIVRYKRLYEFCCEEEVCLPAGQAGNEASLWRMIGAKLLTENIDLPAWEEWKELNKEKILQRFAEAKNIRKIRESIPDWLDELGEKQLGDRWKNEIAALNAPAKFSIRINTLKTNKNVVAGLLSAEGVEFSDSDIAPGALIIHARKNFRNYPAYKNGLFEVQDISSQLVAPLLAPEPGMNVIDGCCGAGGKTLHIGALMQNRGEILAVDTSQTKLDELQRRAIRAGCRIIKPMLAEQLTTRYQQLLHSFADRILLDVPCSGLGVLRRKPDAKWSLSLKFINELIKTQAQILDEYAPMLKPGGLLVYSTCSILPMENEEQVKVFLERNNGRFELLEEKGVSPAETGFDGFYMAKIRRLSR